MCCLVDICVLVFPSAFVFIMSANFVLMFIVVMVCVCFSPIIEVFILFVISFHPPFVWLFIIFAFWILFSMFSLFFCRYGRYVQQPCFYV